MTKKEKKYVLEILKRYWPKKAVEIELAEELKKGIVETPPKTLRKTPPIDVKLPLIKDKEMLPNMVLMPHRADLVPKKTPPIREKDLLANAPNDPDIIY